MGNAGRNGGEYYTPRPLIRAMVQVVQPKIGERIYDGACGSAGFLCEAFDFLKAKKGLTTRELRTLQERTFYGKEKKSLAYVIAIMNMILHGIDAPNNAPLCPPSPTLKPKPTASPPSTSRSSPRSTSSRSRCSTRLSAEICRRPHARPRTASIQHHPLWPNSSGSWSLPFGCHSRLDVPW